MKAAAARAFYRIHERLLRRRTFGILRQLLESQWWSQDRMRALQLCRLQSLMACAYRHAPYWRGVMDGLGLRPEDIRSLDDLRHFPLLDKQTIRRHCEEMVARGVAGGARAVSTSGSTNAALRFYTNPQREAHISAARMRGHLSVGIAPEDREMYFWAAPVELNVQGHLRRFRDWLRNDAFTNAMLIGPEMVREHLRAWERWHPACIFGYPHSLGILTAFAGEVGADLAVLRDKGLRAIVTTAELLGGHRRHIARAFGVPVYDSYGLREGGLIGHECDQFTMHVNDEQVLLETIDRRTGEPTDGEGELVLTMLVSDVMPIIRYRTGDMVTLSSERCACGRTLSSIRMTGGRVLEFIVTSRGRCVNVVAIVHMCSSVKGVRQLQARQDRPGEVKVLVWRDRSFPGDGLDQLSRRLRAHLDPEDRLSFEFVETIPPAPSGKELLVVSKVAREFIESGALPVAVHV